MCGSICDEIAKAGGGTVVAGWYGAVMFYVYGTQYFAFAKLRRGWRAVSPSAVAVWCAGAQRKGLMENAYVALKQKTCSGNTLTCV